MKLESRKIWKRDGVTAVTVHGLVQYQVELDADGALLLAPGVDRRVDWDEFPEDFRITEPDYDETALILVAMFEAGILP